MTLNCDMWWTTNGRRYHKRHLNSLLKGVIVKCGRAWRLSTWMSSSSSSPAPPDHKRCAQCVRAEDRERAADATDEEE